MNTWHFGAFVHYCIVKALGINQMKSFANTIFLFEAVLLVDHRKVHSTCSWVKCLFCNWTFLKKKNLLLSEWSSQRYLNHGLVFIGLFTANQIMWQPRSLSEYNYEGFINFQYIAISLGEKIQAVELFNCVPIQKWRRFSIIVWGCWGILWV